MRILYFNIDNYVSIWVDNVSSKGIDTYIYLSSIPIFKKSMS